MFPQIGDDPSGPLSIDKGRRSNPVSPTEGVRGHRLLPDPQLCGSGSRLCRDRTGPACAVGRSTRPVRAVEPVAGRGRTPRRHRRWRPGRLYLCRGCSSCSPPCAWPWAPTSRRCPPRRRSHLPGPGESGGRRTGRRRPDGCRCEGNGARPQAVEGAAGSVLQRPAPEEGLVPDRAQGHRHDQAHPQGVDDPDRGLLVRPDAGRERAHRRAPPGREGADDPQRPPVHEGDAGRPQGDRRQALPLELHLPVHGRVPEQAEPVQQHAHQVLLVLPGRSVQGRPGRRVGEPDAQRRHPPVERPLLHLR